MKYSRFERLVLLIGGAAILATVAFSFKSVSSTEEIIGQVLMIAVLIGAVHWGRTGGFIAATAASLIYIVMRTPLVTNDVGLTVDIALLIASRVVAYGLIGIVGGELCGRIMYLLARLEGSNSTDDWSHVYNQRFITKSVDNLLGQHRRYGTPFSLVLVNISPEILNGLRVSRQKYLTHHVAEYLRNDIRMVDEVGRLNDGRFLIVLPQTAADGGAIVGDRLEQGVRDTLAARCESVSTTVIAAPENADDIDLLVHELLPPGATIAPSLERRGTVEPQSRA
ncbi:MAG: hypothetical protein PF636_02135 [Actinomycetota bacterium]|jgi:GGDEF domain-containing protein|nr:hypothetical protein [Actinomycetota bacterium]